MLSEKARIWAASNQGQLALSSCAEEAFDADEQFELLDAQQSYYDQPFSERTCAGGPFGLGEQPCDSPSNPDCKCRYGSSQHHYGDDPYCAFGDCFSSDCAPADVKSFTCTFEER